MPPRADSAVLNVLSRGNDDAYEGLADAPDGTRSRTCFTGSTSLRANCGKRCASSMPLVSRAAEGNLAGGPAPHRRTGILQRARGVRAPSHRSVISSGAPAGTFVRRCGMVYVATLPQRNDRP